LIFEPPKVIKRFKNNLIFYLEELKSFVYLHAVLKRATKKDFTED
tara:strand:+ start:1954 stop:2088 length:135 start_codon:yes stop_codon:yes gene_type:complete